MNLTNTCIFLVAVIILSLFPSMNFEVWSIPNAFAQNIESFKDFQNKSPKIDSRLINTDLVSSSASMSTQNTDEMIQAVIVIDTPTEEHLGILASYDVDIETSYGNMIQATFPLVKLENIADLDFVDYIRKPTLMEPMIVSQGASVIGSILMNNAGFTGNNIKVAVLDGGFDITDPEISGNIVESISFRSDDDITGGSSANRNHGTATSQIIVDVAPDVELYLYNSSTGIEFLNMVDFIINNRDIDIISMSAGFLNDAGPFDGTNIIAQKVTEAKNSGILWVNSAGNHAQNHWQGQYSDTDFDDFHNFQGIDETINISILGGETLTVILSWDDWDSPSQDFELIFLDENLNLVTFSVNDQTLGFPPFEVVSATAIFDTTANIVIQKFSANRNVNFQLFTLFHDLDEYRVTSSSILTPADSTGSLTVAAKNFNNDQLESFSSRGPTLDNRIKPDISGLDGVTTSTLNPFFGTSAAAPYVAGAAVLVKEKFPTVTVDELQNLLEFSTASFHPKSNDDGTGRVDLSHFIESDVMILDNSNSNCSVTNSCYFPNIITINQGDSVTWVNSDTADATITSGMPDDGPNGSFDSGLFSRGTAFTHVFNSDGTFDYFDVVHPWATGQVIVNPDACSVPESGDWDVTSNCTLMSNSIAPGNVTIQNTSVLTIPNGVTLDIDFINHNLNVKFGSGVLIKAGGSIT